MPIGDPFPWKDDWWKFTFDTFEKALTEEVLNGEDDVKLQIDLPGHDPKAIKIWCEGQILHIQSERIGSQTGVMKKYRLADTLDKTKIEASSQHGVLTIKIPKLAEESKPGLIEVKVR